MASPQFPQRKSRDMANSAQPGGSAGQLDAPPPSPMTPDPGMGMPQMAMPDLAQISKPFTAGTPGKAVGPEILMGIMSGMETISGMYDSMASILPELAVDFALLKDLQDRTMAKLLLKGGQPSAPNSAGMNFPAGGFERGAQ